MAIHPDPHNAHDALGAHSAHPTTSPFILLRGNTDHYQADRHMIKNGISKADCMEFCLFLRSLNVCYKR